MEDASRFWPVPGSMPVGDGICGVDEPSNASVSDESACALHSGSDDAELVRACRRGSRAAFDLVVERHRRAVYRVCYRFTGNHADASDMTQDVFVRAYRGMGSFKGDAALSTWLYRIAVNACLNHAAVRRLDTTALEPDRHVSGGENADAAVLREERAARVRRAIARLPDRQRATVVLRVYHELTHEEISRVLGNSVGTVKANFFHALRNLRRLLREGGE